MQKIAEGCTYADSCRYAGISIETFCKWKKQFIQFSEAVKKAEDEFRAKIQGELETSLWKRAKGFEWEEVKQEMARDECGNPVPVKQTITKKFTPPDTGALIFALTNIAPEKWRNRQTSELTGKDGKDLLPGPIMVEVIDSRDKVEDEEEPGAVGFAYKKKGKDEDSDD